MSKTPRPLPTPLSMQTKIVKMETRASIWSEEVPAGPQLKPVQSRGGTFTVVTTADSSAKSFHHLSLSYSDFCSLPNPLSWPSPLPDSFQQLYTPNRES